MGFVILESVIVPALIGFFSLLLVLKSFKFAYETILELNLSVLTLFLIVWVSGAYACIRIHMWSMAVRDYIC